VTSAAAYACACRLLGFVEGLQGFLLQVEVAEIIAHEAGEPNAVIDLLDAESLPGNVDRGC